VKEKVEQEGRAKLETRRCTLTIWQRGTMSCILDIDLDYFNQIDSPVERLRELLHWGSRPVSVVVQKHHHAFRKWRYLVRYGQLSIPQFIIHVDEHHDMMDERQNPNLANFMYHVMCEWPSCKVHWLADTVIDHPNMWLGEETWSVLSNRFSYGACIPHDWPKPDPISVSTSPEFVDNCLLSKLMDLIPEHRL